MERLIVLTFQDFLYNLGTKEVIGNPSLWDEKTSITMASMFSSQIVAYHAIHRWMICNHPKRIKVNAINHIYNDETKMEQSGRAKKLATSSRHSTYV